MFLVAFAVNHSIMFTIDIIMIVNPPQDIMSTRKIWEAELTEKLMRFSRYDTNYITILRMLSNIWNMLTLHIFHIMIFIYLSMISALIIHKNTINMKSHIVELFSKIQIGGNRLDLKIRKERQNLIYRLESKIYGSFMTFTTIVFIMYLGFIWTQIVDVSVLFDKSNLYKSEFIEWRISHYF